MPRTRAARSRRSVAGLAALPVRAPGVCTPPSLVAAAVAAGAETLGRRDTRYRIARWRCYRCCCCCGYDRSARSRCWCANAAGTPCSIAPAIASSSCSSRSTMSCCSIVSGTANGSAARGWCVCPTVCARVFSFSSAVHETAKTTASVAHSSFVGPTRQQRPVSNVSRAGCFFFGEPSRVVA